MYGEKFEKNSGKNSGAQKYYSCGNPSLRKCTWHMYQVHIKIFFFEIFKKILRFNNFAQTAASSQLLIGAENSLKVSHKHESYEWFI